MTIYDTELAVLPSQYVEAVTRAGGLAVMIPPQPLTPDQATSLLQGLDGLIITGGATCNCVRATACESFSLNYRTIVPREAVFDRIPLSHEITLFDIDRFLGDVVSTDEVVGYLDGLPRAND